MDLPVILKRIRVICKSREIPIIDAAQAFGATVSGHSIGSFGHAAVFSFGRAKNVNAFYGGIIVTSDDLLAGKIRNEIDVLPDEDFKVLAKRILHCAIGDVATSVANLSMANFQYISLWRNKRG